MTSNARNNNNTNTLSEDDTQEVNKIFSNNTIEQIAVICGQMQQNVKQTRLELRNMIGNRHRELIDSCGELVGIDNVCRELVSMCDETHNQHQQHREKNRSATSSSSSAASSFLASASSKNKTKNKGEEHCKDGSKDNNHHHDQDGKSQKWIDEQMLRAMRASSLLRESELLDAAVQISILERDVSLGIQSLLNNNSKDTNDSSSSSASSLSLPPRFHALQATVKPLRDQWATAASKKLARITNISKNNATSEPQQQHLVILASCFQGWGLLSRGGSPKDSLEYLLLFDSTSSSSSSLCRKTIDRIKSSSSSTTEAVTRISRLLKFISEFLIDLYERGPAALISPSIIATPIINSEKKSVSNSSSPSFFFGVVPTLENTSQEAASSFLSQLSHQVCALGMLDAEKSLSNNNNNSNIKNKQPSLGWASPVMSPSPNNGNKASSPSNNNNNNKMISATNNKSGTDLLLPTIPETLEIFEKCCKTLFAPILTNLIENATDPSNGETSCLKILSSSSSNSIKSASSSSAVLQLTQKIQSILQLQVSNVISNAAGTCILQHLSQSAKELVELAKPLTASTSSPATTAASNTNNNNNEQHVTPALLFQTIRSFIFPSTNQNSNNYNQFSSLAFGVATNKISNNTNRGRLLLSSLMNRPSALKDVSNNNTNTEYRQDQKTLPINNRNMASRSASPGFAGASSSAATLLHQNNLAKINHHLNQTIKHTLSALQRCVSLSSSSSSSTSSNNNNSNTSEIFNNITKIILDLTKELEIATKKIVTNNNNNNNNSDQEHQETNKIQIGIAAAEALRFIVEPLTNLFSSENVAKMIKSQQQISVLPIFTNNTNTNIKEAIQILKTNQSELLSAWKTSVKKSFDSELFSCWMNNNNNNNDNNVLSASELICKADSNSNSIKYPSRPSPSTLAALVNLVKKTTSLFSPINSNDSTSTSETFCPVHVRVELCSELSSQVLKKAMDFVTSSIHHHHHQNDSKSTHQDQKLLQLYFDVGFIIMVLRGNSTNASSSSFALVDVLRKDFIKQVESAIDVVTWSVTKLNVNSAIKAAVDDSYFISSIILLSSNKTLAGPNANKLAATASLKMSTETPCDRLPLLPLVALAPVHNNNNSAFNSNNNNNASSSNFGDNNYNSSNNSSNASSMFGFGTSSGDGNNSNNNNNNNTAMGRAAKELMSQGNALTDKLKSMFW